MVSLPVSSPHHRRHCQPLYATPSHPQPPPNSFGTWPLINHVHQLGPALHPPFAHPAEPCLGSAEGDGRSAFPGGQQFPHSITKTLMLQKGGDKRFQKLLTNTLLRGRDSTHARAKVSPAALRNTGKDISRLVTMTFKYHKCHSAAWKSRKVSENTAPL